MRRAKGGCGGPSGTSFGVTQEEQVLHEEHPDVITKGPSTIATPAPSTFFTSGASQPR